MSNEISQEVLDAIEVNVKMTVKEVNQFLTVLGDAPFVRAASLITLLQTQAAPQVQAAIEAAQAAAPAAE